METERLFWVSKVSLWSFWSRLILRKFVQWPAFEARLRRFKFCGRLTRLKQDMRLDMSILLYRHLHDRYDKYNVFCSVSFRSRLRIFVAIININKTEWNSTTYICLSNIFSNRIVRDSSQPLLVKAKGLDETWTKVLVLQ